MVSMIVTNCENTKNTIDNIYTYIFFQKTFILACHSDTTSTILSMTCDIYLTTCYVCISINNNGDYLIVGSRNNSIIFVVQII